MTSDQQKASLGLFWKGAEVDWKRLGSVPAFALATCLRSRSALSFFLSERVLYPPSLGHWLGQPVAPTGGKEKA